VPIVTIAIGRLIRTIIHNNTAVGAPIKRRTQRLESLLPRRIPQLQIDHFARVERHLPLHEVGADRWLICFRDFLVFQTV
jgi:hypothetical protein